MSSIFIMGLEKRTCRNCKQVFVLLEEDLAMYASFDLPPPDVCVYCTWKYLLSFWVFGRFRIAKSALSGKRIITVLSESALFPIYDREEFVSDVWDPMVYGRAYDPSRSFIEQVCELQKVVPHPHQVGHKNVNCEWTDDWWECRDCYLSRSGFRNEHLTYAYRVTSSKNAIDITYSMDMERSYDCLYCFKCYELFYSFNCHNCLKSAFLYDCRNCTNCFMSWNLRNKQYCILNTQYTKEEYFEKLKEFDLRSYSAVEALRKEFWEHMREDAVHRATFNQQIVNSTGNFIMEDKNCHECYLAEKSQNCRYCVRMYEARDCIEGVSVIGEKTARGALDQWGYETVCNLYATSCRYSAYLDMCEESEYCFGCVGLKKKKFCILNRQYSKEEYETLVGQIKTDMKKRGEWGKFFPLSAAYGGYNDSLGQLMFPMDKSEAISMGMRWEDAPAAQYEGINGNDLPDRIDDVKDDITAQRVICPQTNLSYNIAPHELAFYREHGVPIPRRHFDVRTRERYWPLTQMVKSQKGICVYCQKEIEHYYSPKLGFKKIACVECYQQEIS